MSIFEIDSNGVDECKRLRSILAIGAHALQFADFSEQLKFNIGCVSDLVRYLEGQDGWRHDHYEHKHSNKHFFI